MIQNIIAQKGKKYNDFQGKRLGFVVNDFEEDTDPQTEPGVVGFNDVDLSQENFQEQPGVAGFNPNNPDPSFSFVPVTRIRDKASMFQGGGKRKVKELDPGLEPEAPERNQKLDKFMRLAQFANIVAQGVNHFSGGFVSPTDITEGYWNKLNDIDQGYAEQLRDFNKRAFDTDKYNTDLYNTATLQEEELAARAALAQQKALKDQEAGQVAFDRQKELTQMDIDARAKRLEKELGSKKAYNRIARANNQNDFLDAIQVERENLLNDLSSLEETDALGQVIGYKNPQQAQEKLSDIKALDKEYNDARKQMGDMIGFDTAQPESNIPQNYGGTMVQGGDGRTYNIVGQPQNNNSTESRIVTGPDGAQYRQYIDGRLEKVK